MGEDSVLGFHLVGILAFSLSTQIFFFLATLVLSVFDPLVSVSQPPTCIDGKLELSLKESVEYKYIDDINIRSTKPHLYEAKKSVLGNDCQAIQFNQYNYWKCNNYTDSQNLSFSTIGDTKLIYWGEFYDNFYDFISPYLSDIPFDFIDVFKRRYTATP